MNPTRTAMLAALAAVAVLGGCASPGYYPPASQSYPPVQTYPAASPSYSSTYGTIDSISVRQGAANNGIGVGTVVGGVVGGLLGNQVGSGSGRKAATVAGVVGGAMVGNQMERNTQTRDAYQIGVRMDNGSYQTIHQDNVTDLQVGSRVRIENNRAYRY
ncbi:MAG: glycine zipper 2TM domain-containing protein [Noviherbaspirillum sp.]